MVRRHVVSIISIFFCIFALIMLPSRENDLTAVRRVLEAENSFDALRLDASTIASDGTALAAFAAARGQIRLDCLSHPAEAALCEQAQNILGNARDRLLSPTIQQQVRQEIQQVAYTQACYAVILIVVMGCLAASTILAVVHASALVWKRVVASWRRFFLRPPPSAEVRGAAAAGRAAAGRTRPPVAAGRAARRERLRDQVLEGAKARRWDNLVRDAGELWRTLRGRLGCSALYAEVRSCGGSRFC